MKFRKDKPVKFIGGLLLGLILVPFAAYLYFTGGSAPVATTDSDMPFENFFAHKALNARIAKDMPKNVPIQANEANELGGAELYKQHCAVCHGLPLAPKTAIATGMYPRPPQLFQGKGVTDDEPGESYWKIFNGIRLSGMPGFSKSLSETQMWQLALLLANADKLPTSAKAALVTPIATSAPSVPPATTAPPATPAQVFPSSVPSSVPGSAPGSVPSSVPPPK
jgi:thiosulfate dehydrogenase